MKNKVIIIIVIFSILIIAIISYSIVQSLSHNSEKYSRELSKLMHKKKNYDKLLSIYYSNSGDMNGNVDSLSIDIKEKKITTKYAIFHSDPIEVKEYNITNKDIEKIYQKIEKYNYPMWESLKDSDEIAYDAPVAGISFSYDNSKINGSSYKTYYIGFNKQMEKDTRQELNSFVSYLRSLTKKEQMIKEYETK